MKHLPANPRQLRHARSLRSNMTDAERLLWRQLRGKRFEDARFRRQAPIGPFIVDFYCFELKLIIELDGGQHATETGLAADRDRTAWLMDNGFVVKRYWNSDILGNIEGVLTDLAGVVVELRGKRMHDTFSPTPTLPRWGRESLAASSDYCLPHRGTVRVGHFAKC